MIGRLRKIAVCVIIGGGIQAHANTRCMAAALQFAITDFEGARAKGLEATNLNREVVFLGTKVSVRSVEIRDDNKQSFTVAFHLDSVDSHPSELKLKTTIGGVNSLSCSMSMKSGLPRYEISPDSVFY
jgi:hypothetical protein